MSINATNRHARQQRKQKTENRKQKTCARRGQCVCPASSATGVGDGAAGWNGRASVRRGNKRRPVAESRWHGFANSWRRLLYVAFIAKHDSGTGTHDVILAKKTAPLASFAIHGLIIVPARPCIPLRTRGNAIAL